jgi:regulator of protease activity HflC (stomatin/prohibitin superfamily)
MVQWKKMKRFLPALALFAVGCGTTVRPGQAGVRYSGWGAGLQKDVKNEGFYFQWPWNDVFVYDITWTSKTEEVEALTADSLHVPVKVTVTYRPRRAELPRLATELGRSYYEQVIEPSFLTLTRAEFARYRHNELGLNSPAIEQSIADKLRSVISSKPIEIDRVAISHIQYDGHVTAAISEKRAAVERVDQKASELLIAAQDAEIARTAARGQADALRINAQGQADAIVVRGEAQARAQDEIGKTLTTSYLKYKAFDNDSTRYYFVPVGKDGLPIIVGTDDAPRRPRRDSAPAVAGGPVSNLYGSP